MDSVALKAHSFSQILARNTSLHGLPIAPRLLTPVILSAARLNEVILQLRRIDASHRVDALISEKDREEAAQGEKIWWMTPGWIKFRHEVFKGWDKGLANENFPRHTGGAVVVDAIGYSDTYVAEHPEDLLEYSDWMGIPIRKLPVSLDRFKALLLEQLDALQGGGQGR